MKKNKLDSEYSRKFRISLREIRVFSELVYFFPDTILDYPVFGNRRADMYIPSLKTVVEYDGCYWHRGREKNDREKNLVMYKCGAKVIRIREKPLGKIESPDIVINHREILNACAVLMSQLGIDTLGYNSFLNDGYYQQLMADIRSGKVIGSLKEKYPMLCAEWDYDKNKISPESVSAGSGMAVWWKCSKGHSWKTAVGNRAGKKSGCPRCTSCQVNGSNNLAITYPSIAAEWDLVKNSLTPMDISWSQPNMAWWKCEKCGCSWKQLVISRVRYRNRKYNGCPRCKKRRELEVSSLAITEPKIAREWDYEKNTMRPEDVFKSDDIMVWWKCSRGHSWKAHLRMRSKRKTICPSCRKQNEN